MYFYSVCKFNPISSEETNSISLFYNNGYTYFIRSKIGTSETGELEQTYFLKTQTQRINIAALPPQTEQMNLFIKVHLFKKPPSDTFQVEGTVVYVAGTSPKKTWDFKGTIERDITSLQPRVYAHGKPTTRQCMSAVTTTPL